MFLRFRRRGKQKAGFLKKDSLLIYFLNNRHSFWMEESSSDITTYFVPICFFPKYFVLSLQNKHVWEMSLHYGTEFTQKPISVEQEQKHITETFFTGTFWKILTHMDTASFLFRKHFPTPSQNFKIQAEATSWLGMPFWFLQTLRKLKSKIIL